MSDLYQRSIDIILQNQSENGAYVASPNFPTYHYCWFRDGSFIAYAMDLAGQHQSSRKFHQWVADRVNQRRELVRSSLLKAKTGVALAESEILHTRYRLDGTDGESGNWPNFQLDGFGTWLWALNEHRRLHSQVQLPSDILEAARLVADYLGTLWMLPCYDCWEEFPTYTHPHTLAAIYGGLQAYTDLTGRSHQQVIDAIREQLIANAAEFGHFVKFPGSPAVDASLLGMAVPYGVVAPDDPRMVKTVAHMEETLLHSGGLHRYVDDTYYGGGAWTLLSAWLGWYYVELANTRPDLLPDLEPKIQECRSWVQSQATGTLELPEQVADELNRQDYYASWVERWGDIATPLLWSHAKYIILLAKISAYSLEEALPTS